jgi:hypothetical protein
VNYKIPSEWTSVSTLTGHAIGMPFSITNAGRAGDLIEVIVADDQPNPQDRGEPLAQLLRSYNVSGQTQDVWIRYIRYDLNGTITPEPSRVCQVSIQHHSFITEQGGIPLDAITDSDYGSQRVSTSAQDSRVYSLNSDKLHSISASYTIQAGNSIGLNIAPASEVIISRISCSPSLPITVYNGYATGSADGIFNANNLNLCSTDSSPTNAQVFYSAINTGKPLLSGIGAIDSFIKACELNKPCVMVENTSSTSQVIMVQVLFEETGPRNPSFGLMASTQLIATTEMSQYG